MDGRSSPAGVTVYRPAIGLISSWRTFYGRFNGDVTKRVTEVIRRHIIHVCAELGSVRYICYQIFRTQYSGIIRLIHRDIYFFIFFFGFFESIHFTARAVKISCARVVGTKIMYVGSFMIEKGTYVSSYTVKTR
jgi:hypothetical protein